MKYLIAAILLFPCATRAQSFTSVHQIYLTTSTIVQTVSVTSATATNVASATSSGTLSGYYAIELYNPLGGYLVNYGFDPMVSTQIASVWYGRELSTGAAITLFVPSYTPVYVKTQKISATNLTVTQYK